VLIDKFLIDSPIDVIAVLE